METSGAATVINYEERLGLQVIYKMLGFLKKKIKLKMVKEAKAQTSGLVANARMIFH